MKQLLPKLLNRSYSLLFVLSFLLSSLGWGQTTVIITSGTTYEVPCGVTSMTVELWGGGGAGGGDGTNNSTSGAGGGSGAYCSRVIPVLPGQVFNISIGSSGLGASNAPGGGGGTTTFTGPVAAFTYSMTAPGGGGGAGNGGGGGAAALVATGGTTNLPGNIGAGGGGTNNGATGAGAPNGGGNTFGPGTNTNGNTGSLYGGGGSGGGGKTGGGSNTKGGDGASGAIRITFDINYNLPNAGPDISTCADFSTIGTTPSAGWTYSWSTSAGTLNNGGTLNPNITGLAAGACANVTLTFTETATGCQVSDVVSICRKASCDGTTPCDAPVKTTGCTNGTMSDLSIEISPDCMANSNGTSEYWYYFTPATTGLYDIDLAGSGGGNDNAIAVYTGDGCTTSQLTSLVCANQNNAGNSSETINPLYMEVGEYYYFQLFNPGAGGSQPINNFCIALQPNTNVTSCNYTFTDTGGAGGTTALSNSGNSVGNYNNNEQYTYTFCPSIAGQYVSLNFAYFQTENQPYDFMTIYNGSGTQGLILGFYYGTDNPGVVTSSDPSGCLTVRFTSDGIANVRGWEAALTCVPDPGVLPTPTAADCLGAIGMCADSDVNVNGLGAGNYDDLSTANDGCLYGEHNSVWFFVKIDDADGDGDISTTGSGTLGFTLTMPNQVDYDYAVWGPLEGTTPSDFCSPELPPVRCSWATASGNSNTTMGMDAITDPDQVSEDGGLNEDGWVYWLNNVRDGEIYLVMIDRWGASSQHDYNINFTGTASNAGGLDCIVTLPIDMYTFEGLHIPNRSNYLVWKTMSEQNSDYFQIERSKDGSNWDVIGSVQASFNSTELKSYEFEDFGYYAPVTYYRIKLVDADGQFKYSSTIAINADPKFESIFSDVYPNPSSSSCYFNYGGKDFINPISVSMVNMNGSVITSTIIEEYNKSQAINIDLSSLPNGVYQMIITQGETREVKKISVLR